MIRLSRPVKMLLSLLMSSVLFVSLYSAWSAAADDSRANGADLLGVRLILLDLYTLEASSGIDPTVRRARLVRLAERLNAEASRSPENALLQAENIILQMVVGAHDAPLVERMDRDEDLDIPDPELKRLVRTIYFVDEGESLDISLFLERMGQSWFSLSALVHYGERRGDRSLATDFEARLGVRSRSVVAKLGRLGLVVGGAAVTGLFLWGRYFAVVRLRGRTRCERVLPRANWNALDGYFLFLLFFCLLSGVAWLMAPLLTYSEGLGLSPVSAVPLLYLLQTLAGLFILQRFFFPGGLLDTFRRMGGALGQGSATEAVAWGIGGYAATLPVVLGVLYLSSQIVGRTPVSSNPVIPLILEAATPGEQLILFMTVALLAPAFEEVFFRGFLFNAFRAKFGTSAGMVLGSLLFSLIHFDFAMLPGLFTIGIMLSFVYYHTQSLAAPILLHGLWNTTTLVAVQALFS